MSEQTNKLPDIRSEQMIAIKILSYLRPNLLTIQARKKLNLYLTLKNWLSG